MIEKRYKNLTINNFTEFFDYINSVIEKLIQIGDIENAKKLQNALQISNFGLEILGEIRRQLKYLEKNKIFKKIDMDSEIKELGKFISKYWPGY
jgi:hypothetical protein